MVRATVAAFTFSVLPWAGAVLAQQSSPAVASPTPTREVRGNLVLEGVPEPDAALSAKLDQWLAGRSARFLDHLPDGALLVATRFGDVEQLHRVAAPLGMREQLTFDPEPVGDALVPPVANAPGFVYLKDRGGNENAQLWFYRFSDRSSTLLTDGRSRHGGAVWSRDGRRIAFFGTGRDGVSHDIYVAELTGAGPTAAFSPPRLLLAGQRKSWAALDWSLDGTRLLVRQYVSITESYLFLVDAQSGALTPVDPPRRNERIAVGKAQFAPDGRSIYLVSDRDSEFRRLRRFDPVTGESEVLTEFVPWDIEEFDVSADGRYVAWVVNADGVHRLQILDTRSRSELAPSGVPQGLLDRPRFDRSGRRLVFTAESATSPRDVFAYDLERNETVRWTRSETGPVDPARFVPAELVRFPTWDRVRGAQRQIPAFVYRPRTPGPHPVLITIHGGPESQYQPGFDAKTQFLVNELGYAVIAPNVRGSSGYGRSFLALDDGRLREDSVRDIGSLLVWIGLQPWLDARRVVVQGGSYGGYMTLASLVHYSDRLRGGVNVVGISNFVTFLQNTAPYRQDLRRVEYGDERDPRMRAFLQRISPLNNADRIRRPLFIVQGLNDPRVPASESEQMVAQLRRQGSEVWYLAAKDEGHGFRKKPNRDFYLKAFATFLQRMK